jgi:hypothetical protein
MSYEQEINRLIEKEKKDFKLFNNELAEFDNKEAELRHAMKLAELHEQKAGAILADDHGLKVRYFEKGNPYRFDEGWGYFANEKCGWAIDGQETRLGVLTQIARSLEPDFQVGFLVQKNAADNDRFGLWSDEAPNSFMRLEALRLQDDVLHVYSPEHGRVGALPTGLVMTMRNGEVMNLERRQQLDLKLKNQLTLSL